MLILMEANISETSKLHASMDETGYISTITFVELFPNILLCLLLSVFLSLNSSWWNEVLFPSGFPISQLTSNVDHYFSCTH